MPDEVRVLTRNETEQYIIKERFAKQYSSVDGGWEARFRLAQGSMAGQLAHASDPVKNAELAGALNSLRAFSLWKSSGRRCAGGFRGAQQTSR